MVNGECIGICVTKVKVSQRWEDGEPKVWSLMHCGRQVMKPQWLGNF